MYTQLVWNYCTLKPEQMLNEMTIIYLQTYKEKYYSYELYLMQ